MAHTYVIQSITHDGTLGVDVALITGTVDGIPVSVTTWWSLIQKQANTAGVQAVVQPLMLAAAFPAAPVAVNTFDSTWTA